MAASGTALSLLVAVFLLAAPVVADAEPPRKVHRIGYRTVDVEIGKALELLRDTVPHVRRVAVLSNPANPAHAPSVKNVKAAARSLGVQLQLLVARGPNDSEAAFATMAKERAGPPLRARG